MPMTQKKTLAGVSTENVCADAPQTSMKVAMIVLLIILYATIELEES